MLILIGAAVVIVIAVRRVRRVQRERKRIIEKYGKGWYFNEGNSYD